jgi:hypothetical protein
MISYEFTVDVKRFKKRIKSDLQHKIRVALKCYTIFNFELNDSDRTFTFNAKYRQYSTKIIFISKNKDGTPKTYRGKYDYEQFQNGTVKVIITVEFEKNKIE